VDEFSATMGLPNEVALPLAGSNHKTMCKFRDSDHQRYLPIWDAIEDLVKVALADSPCEFLPPAVQPPT
jgi:hypothetical protein